MDQISALGLPLWAVAVFAVLILIVVPVITSPTGVEWVKGRFARKAPPQVEPPKPDVLDRGAAALDGDFLQGRLLAEQDESAEYRQEIRDARQRIEQLLTERGQDRAEIARLRERVIRLGGDLDDQ